ncbi:MAG: acetyl-CoA carboxylase biotin carboxyl carrier protein [Bdellovibrio sp.]|nr:acetyl-CoA carboxylase biotin carboxyl carrier protein [Bdellovibrio sp.]
MAKPKKAKAVGRSSRPASSESRQGDLQHLEQILELMEKHEVGELEWEKSGERIKLKSRHAAYEIPQLASMQKMTSQPQVQVVQQATSSSEAPKPQTNANSAVTNGNQKPVVSPFVGTFYRSPSPTAEPYIREGQVVKRGDVLCIIEAMKLMNEIEAEFPGKVVSVMAENGQPVEFGEPLFLIEP